MTQYTSSSFANPDDAPPVPRDLSRLTWLVAQIATLAFFALPIALFWAVETGALDPAAIQASFPNLPIPPDLTQTKAIAVLTIGALPVLAIMYALWHTRRFFRRISRGEMLTHGMASNIFSIGRGLAAASVFGLAAAPAQALVLAPYGGHGGALAVTYGGAEVCFMLASALLCFVGWFLLYVLEQDAQT